MQRLLKFLLVWVVSVALPLQGAVAALMPPCGAGLPASIEAGRDVMAADTHHGAMHAAVAIDTTHVDHGRTGRGCADARSPHDRDGHHVCGLCAACGWHAPLPTSLVSTTVMVTTRSFADFLARTPPAFLTTGIERPPRHAFV